MIATKSLTQVIYFLKVVGQGAYGVVVAAKDKEAVNQEKNLVAIKKIDKAFEHKIFTKRTLRELRLLKLLKHENVLNNAMKIIGVDTIILPKSREDFEDMYSVSLSQICSVRINGNRSCYHNQERSAVVGRTLPVLPLPNIKRAQIHPQCQCSAQRFSTISFVI
jgi:serine/threonine protein kinase